MLDRVDVLVSLDGSRPTAEVVTDLEARSFRVDRVLDAVGVVTGSVSPDLEGGLRSVSGVSSVERDGVVRAL